MNNDVYAEQLIEKRAGTSVLIKKVLIILAVIALSLAAFMFLYSFGLIIAAAACYGGYYLLTGEDIEYEYIFTNGDMDVDKIKGRRTRKRLVTADCSRITSFGAIANAPEIHDDVTTVIATDGTGEGEYYMDFIHSNADIGRVRIIFTPEEKIINAILTSIPRQAKAEYLKNKDIVK